MREGILNDIQRPFRKFRPGSCHAYWWESNVLCSMGIACVLEAAQSFRVGTEKQH